MQRKLIDVDQFKLAMMDRMIETFISTKDEDEARDNVMNLLCSVMDVVEFAQEDV